VDSGMWNSAVEQDGIYMILTAHYIRQLTVDKQNIYSSENARNMAGGLMGDLTYVCFVLF